MNPGLVVKFRAIGPWRIGPDSGARDRADLIYHSDSVFSAVTHAMARMGLLEEWLANTVSSPAGPAVRFSSLFPFHNEIGFVTPPRTIWPPPASPRIRWKTARFIPLGLVDALLSGHVLEEESWNVDAASECLTPAGRHGPFRLSVRTGAAVDRLNGNMEPHVVACIEFQPGSGLWGIVEFATSEARDRWDGPVRGALRLLADSGFGGKRSRGWGRAGEPEFVEGELPSMILPRSRPAPESTPSEQTASEGADVALGSPSPASDTEPPSSSSPPPASGGHPPAPPQSAAYWLLSLFTPDAQDAVNWQRGNYGVIRRSGRVESPARSGDLKKPVNMVTEGSVLLAEGSLRGKAADVSPDGFAHPVYRSGFALAIPVAPQVGS